MSVQNKIIPFSLRLYFPLLYICLISSLTINFSFAKAYDEAGFTNPFDLAVSLANDENYHYLSKDEISSLHKGYKLVDGWATVGNSKYLNFNTVKWDSLVNISYQIKVNVPESPQYDYYIESNVIDCVSGINRQNQKIDYYKGNKIINTEENFKFIDYSNVSTALLVCSSVKLDYTEEILRVSKERYALQLAESNRKEANK